MSQPAAASPCGQPAGQTVVRGACAHDCPDTCSWVVTVESGKAVDLKGDATHPFTRGGLCAKVDHYLDRVYSPDRVLHPLRRVGPKGAGQFERVTWDAALDHIAAHLKDIIEKYGGPAVLPYSFAGDQGLIHFSSLDRRFFSRIRATRLVRGLCGDTAAAGLAASQGTGEGIDPEDLRHSRFIILWGTNTIVTNLHLWPYIREARVHGATVVVIDPLRTRTAQAADWHIRPLPGTDAALALGMMHVIVKEGLLDAEYVERYTLGFDRLRERLQEYPPEHVARITGLEMDEIVRLARAYATTRPAVIRLLIGLEHHENGAMTFRTIACLPALIGAWRERGGGLARSTYASVLPALNLAGLMRTDLEDPSIRVVNMAQLGKALTDPTLDPPIKALIVYNCNPATITPNQNLVLKGLRREDLLTVVHEQFITDTARYADYVLPATTQLEHLDIVPSWGHFYLPLNKPAIPPLGEAVRNTEFFRRLAARMGLTDDYLFESDETLIRTALQSSHPLLAGITYERLTRESWVRLNVPGDFRPFAEGGFSTPSRRLEFYSEGLKEQGFDPLPTYVPPQEGLGGNGDLLARYPLQLISSKSALHFLNSSYAHLPRHRAAEREPLLDITSVDAASRSINDGDSVRVFNDRGAMELRARVSDRVRPGVVAAPFGWWASPNTEGSSSNALTADALSDWGGTGAFFDTLVEVAAVRRT